MTMTTTMPITPVMTVINLTPHAINIVGTNATLTVPTSGTIARIACTSESCGCIATMYGDIPLVTPTFGDPTNLPDPQVNTVYIVSALVQTTVKRGDLLVPNDLVRDDKGNIIGCRALASL